MLIHRFQPEYNEVKFSNYPNIKGGMRSMGYTDTRLALERLPAFLYSDRFSMVPIIDGEAVQPEKSAEDGCAESSLVEELMRQVRERQKQGQYDALMKKIQKSLSEPVLGIGPTESELKVRILALVQQPQEFPHHSSPATASRE